jgi:hypothetical protein
MKSVSGNWRNSEIAVMSGSVSLTKPGQRQQLVQRWQA